MQLGEWLKTVNCSNKKLSSVPRGIPFDTETLLLSNNELTDLHEQLPQLDQLLHLDLSRNKLKQLGECQWRRKQSANCVINESRSRSHLHELHATASSGFEWQRV